MTRNRRTGMKMLYIGDVGEIPDVNMAEDLEEARKLKAERIAALLGGKDFTEEELLAMPFRQFFNIAVEAGMKITDLIGIKNCYEHTGFKQLRHNMSLPVGYNLADDVVHCKNCFCQFIKPRKKGRPSATK